MPQIRTSLSPWIKPDSMLARTIAAILELWAETWPVILAAVLLGVLMSGCASQAITPEPYKPTVPKALQKNPLDYLLVTPASSQMQPKPQ